MGLSTLGGLGLREQLVDEWRRKVLGSSGIQVGALVSTRHTVASLQRSSAKDLCFYYRQALSAFSFHCSPDPTHKLDRSDLGVTNTEEQGESFTRKPRKCQNYRDSEYNLGRVQP